MTIITAKQQVKNLSASPSSIVLLSRHTGISLNILAQIMLDDGYVADKDDLAKLGLARVEFFEVVDNTYNDILLLCQKD